MEEKYGQEDMRKLAADIVNRIIRDDALLETLAGRLQYTCPRGQLCCDVGYGCDSPFVCRPGFDCMKVFANYPP